MSFQISPLAAKQFEHLLNARSEDLASFHAVRMIAAKKPGFPCRVSLSDAEVGEEVVLVHYQHQPVSSPFRASHAVYVRPNAQQANPAKDEVPIMLRSRILSLRGFDRQGMMVAADLVEGVQLEQSVEAIFLDPAVAYIHIHFAKPGCYAARVDRA